ncbi:hypothetical protein [Chryseobacterium gleum]|uniref:hypothetical protein n=1 Tax=Chryseobacterium gleum TaxID=250 RepID=UPI0031D4E6EE
MILKSQEELINEINNGQNLSSEASQSFVFTTPDNFNQWISENMEMLDRRKNKPNFLEENKKFVK